MRFSLRRQGTWAGHKSAMAWRMALPGSNMASLGHTSRTRQEPTLSHRGIAPGARVFATRGLRDRKALANSERLKKRLAKSKRRKTNYGRFKMGTQNHQWGKRGHGPDRSQNHLILVHLPVVDQKESPTSEVFLHWRSGPILTRIGAYENQDLELFHYVRARKEKWVSGFLFSDRKRKQKKGGNRFFSSWLGLGRIDRKKTSRVTLGTFFGRPNPQ